MTPSTTTAGRPWRLLAEVMDPEMPAVSVLDLGIVRALHETADGRGVRVTITPTYSGCPATAVIAREVEAALAAAYDVVEVRVQLSPPWSTDWLSDEGRRKLHNAGIAPPPHRAPLPVVAATWSPVCPQCDATDVEEISEFGAAPCRGLWRCRMCREPFDAVKPL